MDISDDKISFNGPAKYRIIVQGKIPSSFKGRLGAMKLLRINFADSEIESVLEGRIADQTELAGILKTLYKLHLPIRKISLQKNNTNQTGQR